MRFYVTITSAESEEVVEKLCLEAAHWQPALQEARELRGETKSLKGVSVDFLDDGCDATDSELGLRYLVESAPDDAEIKHPAKADSAGDAPEEAAAKKSSAGKTGRKASRRSSRKPLKKTSTKTTESEKSPAAKESASASDGDTSTDEAKPARGSAKRRADRAASKSKEGTARPSRRGKTSSPDSDEEKAPKRRSSRRAVQAATKDEAKKASEAKAGENEKDDKSTKAAKKSTPKARTSKTGRVRRTSRKRIGSQPSEDEKATSGENAAPAPVRPQRTKVGHAAPDATDQDVDKAAPSKKAKADSKPGRVVPADDSAPPVPSSKRAAAASKPKSRSSKKSTERTPLSLAGARAKLLIDAREPAEEADWLTVIEQGYGVALSPNEVACREFLQERLTVLRDELGLSDGEGSNGATHEAYLADLAVFDHIFKESPERPPVATLRWCSWRPDSSAVELSQNGVGVKNAEAADSSTKEQAQPDASVQADAESASDKSAPAEKTGAGKEDADKATGLMGQPRRKRSASRSSLSRRSRPSSRGPVSRRSRPSTGEMASPYTKTDEPGQSADQTAAKKVDKGGSAQAGGAKATEKVEPKQAAADDAASSSATNAKNKGGSRRAIGGRRAIAKKTQAEDEKPPSSRAPVSTGVPRPAAKSKNLKPLGANVPRPSSGGLRRRGNILPLELDDAPPPSRAEKRRRMSDARERASLIPPPASMRGERVAGDDLISDMFEAAVELNYIDNVVDGAAYVLQLTMEKLPSEVGMVSLFDLDQRSFVVVRQNGGDGSAVLMRLPEDAGLAKQAMKGKQTIIVGADDVPAAIKGDERWQVLGVEPTALLCAPVQLSGRYLGLIELANPHDGEAFTAADGNALNYVAEHFSKYLDERGLMIDPDDVLASLSNKG